MRGTMVRLSIAYLTRRARCLIPPHQPSSLCIESQRSVIAELNAEDLAAGKHLFDVRTTGDASESALVKFCQKLRDVREYRAAYPEIFGVPFNSINKFQLSVHSQPGSDSRLLVVMKGAPERIVARCSQIAMPGGALVPLDDEARTRFQRAYDEMGGQGERVLGFA